MKTTMKELAAGTFIALLVLAGNVKAEATELKASSREIVETSLQLENWMTDETIWNTNSLFNLETEEILELENWMTSENAWNSSFDFSLETEVGMELENWMTNEEVWNVEETINEADLLLENWMVDSEVWK